MSIPNVPPKQDNGNVHRAAAKDMQAEKAARPAAPVQRIVIGRYSEVPLRYAL
jgi:hypothetical protein